MSKPVSLVERSLQVTVTFEPLRLTWGNDIPADDAQRLAALQPRIRQAYARLSQLRDAFFVALRAGPRTPEQLSAIEREQCDAATALALQELKRLEIAKALAIRPRVLLLDEVLAGLESRAKHGFMLKLKELHALFGLTIVIVEHDIETISNLCSRAVVLDFGRLIADGTPDAVFRDPEVVRSYTGGTH